MRCRLGSIMVKSAFSNNTTASASGEPGTSFKLLCSSVIGGKTAAAGIDAARAKIHKNIQG